MIFCLSRSPVALSCVNFAERTEPARTGRHNPNSRALLLKRSLWTLALALAGVASLSWLVLGAHRGWTRTSVPVKIVDEITGIQGIEYRKRFVPGVDFLGAALLGAGILAGLSMLVPKPPTQSNQP